MPKKIISDKAERFTESVIRDMTRQANLYGAVNLSQGFPDFAAPAEIKRAACDAIMADINQYAITWGAKSFRDAIAEKAAWYLGLEVDPERELTVTCGSTEAMIAAMMAIVNPGDEVIVFEPFYENYGPDAILSGATPRYVTLREPDWAFDPAELASAFNDKTKAIIINTPNNPTGKVFDRAELELIAGLCQKWNVIAITDEIYEHILFNGKQHVALATLDGMRDRTITINGLSKTYSVTGWRVGYTIAPPEITLAIRKVHDFLTVGAAAPLQEAGAYALRLPRDYYDNLQSLYTEKRERLLSVLKEVGFRCFDPDGAYYVMTDISAFGHRDDLEFARFLVKEVGVAVVP
ncbi:MAG TPA: aminotransferase class I/II-fold pyridoxal phosphate-dependent enzyme, partial [Blastocatellia bacterium]|nr:aminotransferase class I/II-fold pyridoxal phosphate-dependent enzyme [Blastocatellia bacterium]